jgi:nicotinate (nicotinamide) nucleotide adenylyltransferase
MKKIGLFGVTGNPPHLGHLKVVMEALNSCDEVWVTPVYIHPFNKSFIDYNHRLEMLNMLFSRLENVKILEIDKDFYIKHNKTPYSYELLKYIKEQTEDVSPYLVIGEDNYKENVWKKFYLYDKIESEFGVIVVKDSGVHSTQVRSLCSEGKWDLVAQECGEPIAQYLKSNLIDYVGA